MECLYFFEISLSQRCLSIFFYALYILVVCNFLKTKQVRCFSCVVNNFINLNMDLLYFLISSKRWISQRDVSLVGDRLDTLCCPPWQKIRPEGRLSRSVLFSTHSSQSFLLLVHSEHWILRFAALLRNWQPNSCSCFL